MKIESSGTPVHSSGLKSQGSFSIKTTAKAFKILSDGLYSDKILAIVRELSCNAYDAHVAAGKADVPFKIHLPTTIEPWFSVIDYGIGLSHNDVVDIYTTYFESTKSDSNDYIGALGLGSKSPFSYTDTFTVISKFYGEKRTYTAFIDEAGVPSIALMAEEETSDDNGIEVLVPVNNRDINSFEQRARKALRFFKTKPEFNIPVKFEDGEVLFSGTNWKIIKVKNYSDFFKVYAVQGNVGYLLNQHSFNIDLPESVTNVLNGGQFRIEVEFDIGELDVAASREGLSYDERTQKNIIKKLRRTHRDITKIVKKDFNDCKTKWEIHKKYREVFMYNNAIVNITGPLDIEFKNEKINSPTFLIDTEDFPNLRIRKFKKYGSVITEDTGVTDKKGDEVFRLNPTKDTVVVYDNLGLGVISRAKHYASLENKNVYLIASDNDKVKTLDKDSKELKNFLKVIDGAEIIDAASLPKPPTKARGKNTTSTVYAWDGFKNTNQNGWWARSSYISYKFSSITWEPEEDVDELLEESGYYIELYRHSPINPLSPYEKEVAAVNPKEFNEMLKVAKSFELFGKDFPVIYGVRSSKIKDFDESKNWKNFIEVLKEKIEDLSKTEKIKKLIEAKGILKVENEIDTLLKVIPLDSYATKKTESPVLNFLEKAYNMIQLAKNYNIQSGQQDITNTFSRVAKTFDIDIEVEIKDSKIHTELKNIITNYPMLDLVFRLNKYQLTKDDTDLVLGYINQIDNKE